MRISSATQRIRRIRRPRPTLRPVAVVAAAVTVLGLLGASGPRVGLTESVADAARPKGDHTVRTVGKLVTELEDGQYGVCSGAIVDSPSGSVVATAAHCLTSPDSPAPPTRAWFAPEYGYTGAQRAVDEGWRVLAYHTPPAWDVDRALTEILPHDYAFVTVEKRAGRTIRDTYGGNKLDYEPITPDDPVTPYGYPVAPPDGEAPLASCYGIPEVLTSDTAHRANVGGLLLDDCEGLTEGASGGPWLRDLDTRSGTGRLVGVMSVGGDGEVLARPYPAGPGRTLLARADAAAR